VELATDPVGHDRKAEGASSLILEMVLGELISDRLKKLVSDLDSGRGHARRWNESLAPFCRARCKLLLAPPAERFTCRSFEKRKAPIESCPMA